MRHSSVPVAWSSASTPLVAGVGEHAPVGDRDAVRTDVEPAPGALVQRVAPVSASTATTTPEPPWKYTVPSTTTGAVDNVPATGCSDVNATSRVSTFLLVMRLPTAVRALS